MSKHWNQRRDHKGNFKNSSEKIKQSHNISKSIWYNKAIVTGDLIIINTNYKEVWSQVSKLTSYLKELEKEQINTKVNRLKLKKKIKAEMILKIEKIFKNYTTQLAFLKT